MWRTAINNIYSEHQTTIPEASTDEVFDDSFSTESNKVIWNETSTDILELNFQYYSNRSHFNDIFQSEVQNHGNNDLFPGYSQELLCFGAACSLIFAVFGVFGNFISILALSNSKQIRNVTTAFIVNLCVSDLLFSCFCMPMVAQVFLTRQWFSSDAICKFFAFIRFYSPMVSMFTVLAITINRFVLIVYPSIYPSLYRKIPMAFMIGIIWLFPLILLLLPLSGVWGKLGHHPKNGTCTIFKVDRKSPKMFIYIIGLLVPSILLIICYITIYIMVWKIEAKTRRWENSAGSWWTCFKRNKKSSHVRDENCTEVSCDSSIDKNRLRLVRIMLVIFTLFTICYFPMFYLKVFRKGKDIPALNIFAYICYFFSAVINPVIYIAMSTEYRKAYKSLFC